MNAKKNAFLVNPFRSQMLDQAQALLERAETSVRKDILSLLEESGDNGRYISGPAGMEAIGAHTGEPGDNRASLTAFVHPELRMQGRGSALVETLLSDLEEKQIPAVYADFDVDSDALGFAQRYGFCERFYSCRMTYRSQGITPPQQVPISGYCDSDFEQVQSLIARAFEPMRRRLDIQPYLLPPTQRGRTHFQQIQDGVLTVRRAGQIIGAISFCDGEIDDLAVEESCRGQGIGKALVASAVNCLIDRGAKEIFLWVVSDNPARSIYESLGFKKERESYFCIRQTPYPQKEKIYG